MEAKAEVVSIAVRDRVEEAIARDGLSQATIARETGLSSATVSQYLGGTYKGNIPEIERKLRKWLDSRSRRTEMLTAMPPAPDYFPSPSALKIGGALEYLQQAADLGNIIAGPGVGKTSAAREQVRHAPNCWLATMTPDCSSVVMMLNEICDAIGVHPEYGRGARSMRIAICSKLRGSRGLLIIDEAQHSGRNRDRGNPLDSRRRPGRRSR